MKDMLMEMEEFSPIGSTILNKTGVNKVVINKEYVPIFKQLR